MIGGKIKIAVAAVLAGTLITGNAVLATTLPLDGGEGGEGTGSGVYTLETGGSTLKVDTETLNLTVTRGNRTWYSGKRYSENDGLNNLWASKLTDGVTVGYRRMNTLNAYERSLSSLNPKINFTERADGFDARINCRTISVVFTMQVRLNANKLTVKVPFDSITENNSEDYKLEYLLIYPFFDSSYSQTEGGILVPDGSGAVMDLSVKTVAKQPYSARVYGNDYGISFPQVTVNAPETATMPVFATMYPDGGTMFTADSGAEYCSINASVSSITTNYNFANFNWIYREPYVKYYESSGTDGKSYVTFQEDMNKFDLVQTMTLIEGECGVSEIAEEYRKTVDFKGVSQTGAAGLRLQFLMAENKKGMFGNEVVTMTGSSYIESVAEEASAYCDNLSVSVLGYTKGGLNNSYPNHFPIDRGSGGDRGYRSLSEKLSSAGIKFSFTTDFIKAYMGAGVDERSLALNISNQFTVLDDNRSGSTAKFRLVNPDDAAERIKNDMNTVKNFNAGADYASIGSLLYSGYKNRDYDRAYAADKFREAVASAGTTANIVKPNAYMWSVCDSYLDAPIASSGFMIETESVPFLQMVVSGKMPLYSSAVNLNYTGDDLILRLTDYNVYPTFLLTEKDATELYGTNSSGVFTSSYSIWKDTVKEVYSRVNGVLSQVAGSAMVKRYEAADGVFVTEYSNGKKVVVNYGGSGFESDGMKVAAKSAAAFDITR